MIGKTRWCSTSAALTTIYSYKIRSFVRVLTSTLWPLSMLPDIEPEGVDVHVTLVVTHLYCMVELGARILRQILPSEIKVVGLGNPPLNFLEGLDLTVRLLPL